MLDFIYEVGVTLFVAVCLLTSAVYSYKSYVLLKKKEEEKNK